MTSGRGYYGYSDSGMSQNMKVAKTFKCKDCGHEHDKPYPPLPEEKETSAPQGHLESLTCYVTKLNFLEATEEIFGFGIAKGGSAHNPSLTSPCEFMTADGFR